MKAVTIKRLYELLKEEVKNGRGDKKILLSNDDEGNGYHQMFYELTTIKEEDAKYYDEYMLSGVSVKDAIKDYVILG